MNMYFSQDETRIIEKHLSLIEQIVKTSSSSYITIEAKEELLKIAVNHKLATCTTCSSGLFMAVIRIYGHYVEDLNEIRQREEQNQTKSVKTKTRKTKSVKE